MYYKIKNANGCILLIYSENKPALEKGDVILETIARTEYDEEYND